ncbi:FtsK/SpoIIIE domain-containing protein [Paenibacillus lactis]|uniref:FtsK/SpoIIIE domain-containing protein n=1 Tax=Paenibacillus lactis TaxID=228574 RepID=UPI0035A246EB
MAGISGGGKSVMIRSILTSLAGAGGQELYLCDLKGGVELGLFKSLQCVKAFATTLSDVLETATVIKQEMIRRYSVMSMKIGLKLSTSNGTCLTVSNSVNRIIPSE